MANRDVEGYYVHNDELGLLSLDSTVDGQQSITSMKKIKKNEVGEDLSAKSSQETTDVTEHRADGHAPTPCAANVSAFHEGRSSLGGYSNSLCPDQDSNKYSAGSNWQGGVFTPIAYTPTAVATDSTSVKHVPDYLALSIITTIFFFLPIGIFAIKYAIKAKGLKRSGHYTKAVETATQALHLNILTIVMGVICYATTGFMMWYNVKRMENLANP